MRLQAHCKLVLLEATTLTCVTMVVFFVRLQIGDKIVGDTKIVNTMHERKVNVDLIAVVVCKCVGSGVAW